MARKRMQRRRAGAVAAPADRGQAQDVARAFYWLVGLALVVAGFYAANLLRWYGDDVFITLRYVENWLAGHGIVYNPGERVEGYTHFLWLLLLAVGGRLGADPLAVALNLGLLSLVGVLALYVWQSWRIQRRHLRWAFPVTALALALHFHFREWATGGLETMFFTLLVSALPAVLFGVRWSRRRRLWVAGLLHAALFLTRPDGALFALLVNGLLVAEWWLRQRPWRRVVTDLVVLNVPTALIVLPYLAWKVSYYGDVFPNTYYAKAAYLSHYGQGWIYFKHYFGVYWSNVLWVVPWVGFNAALLGRAGWNVAGLRKAAGVPAWREINAVAAFTWVYLILFVMKVGGGFMYARFVIPLVPFFYFLLEYATVEWWALQRGRVPAWLVWGLAAVLAALSRVELNNFYERMTQPGGNRQTDLPGVRKGRIWKQVDGIGDEMMFYKAKFPGLKAWAEALRPYFEGLDVTVLNYGQCAFTYWAKFPVVIEGFGLCDSFIARLPVRKNWRVGHMKAGPLWYYERRGVDFKFYRSPEKQRDYRFVYFVLPEMGGGVVWAEMLTYDKRLVRALDRRMGRKFRHVDVERLVAQWVRQLPQTPVDTVVQRYQDLWGFYFAVNDDSVTRRQQRAFEEALRQYGRDPEELRKP